MKRLNLGKSARVAPAGVDRQPVAGEVSGTVVSVKIAGRQCLVTLTTAESMARFQPAGLARLWVASE